MNFPTEDAQSLFFFKRGLELFGIFLVRDSAKTLGNGSVRQRHSQGYELHTRSFWVTNSDVELGQNPLLSLDCHVSRTWFDTNGDLMCVSTQQRLAFSHEIPGSLKEQGERAKWTNACKAGGPIKTGRLRPSAIISNSPLRLAGQRAAQACHHQPGEELLRPLAAAPQCKRKGTRPRGVWERRPAEGLASPKREGPRSSSPSAPSVDHSPRWQASWAISPRT